MKDKLPPKTGLDFGAMMDEIDDQEELKKVLHLLHGQTGSLPPAPPFEYPSNVLSNSSSR